MSQGRSEIEGNRSQIPKLCDKAHLLPIPIPLNPFWPARGTGVPDIPYQAPAEDDTSGHQWRPVQ